MKGSRELTVIRTFFVALVVLATAAGTGHAQSRAVGSVAVASPTSADIWLDDRKVGEARAGADLILNDIPTGAYRLIARKGARTWERMIDIGAGGRTEVVVRVDLPVLPRLDVLRQVLPIVDQQYFEPADFARFRLGAARGIAAVVPETTFRVEESDRGPAVVYQPRNDPAARVVFNPTATRSEAENDVRFLAALAGELAPNVSAAQLETSIVSKALSALDAHSAYLDPDEYRDLQASTSGTFGGLGIEITLKDETLTVVAPIEGTPAHRAGIRAGDQIVTVDGQPTAGMPLAAAVRRMRGHPGSRVTIGVSRASWPAPRDIEIIREQIRVQAVQSRPIENGIGYIKLRQFQETAAGQMDAALTNLRGSHGPLRGLVLDLRNNPGGLLTAAVEVAEKFLDDGKLVVSTRGRVANQNMRFNARAKRSYKDFAMVVLVNKGSASASEIVAGALQDSGRAIVVGSRSFGKGSVQTIIPISPGAVRLTTAEYMTPSGRTIHGKGITPDVVIEDADTADPSAAEAVLARAVAILKERSRSWPTRE